jgi:hypothetical protein
VRFAGLRLVTAAFEQAHVRDELRSDAYGLLAPAEKLLRRPDDAVELLGLA